MNQNSSQGVRNSVQDRVVLSFMALIPSQSLSSISIQQICLDAQVHRASFYRYFEGLVDLEERFLHLFFFSTVAPATSFPRTKEDLSERYQSLVRAMQNQKEFFRAVMSEPRLAPYRERWRNLVEQWIRVLFRDQNRITEPLVWELNAHFAIGVIQHYCELAFQGKTETSLPELTAWMMEYLLGGLARLDHRALEGPERDNAPLGDLLSRAMRPGRSLSKFIPLSVLLVIVRWKVLSCLLGRLIHSLASS